ncbi:hypothetical protein [Pulveribacter sp.]|uniref:DUF7657 domain-containing protein n=1 Tax=Pulveribacter sp. TaxID=2678893 RepID=UPI0028A9465F|nr:hypothetical protein [Pulveribacter sp.]
MLRIFLIFFLSIGFNGINWAKDAPHVYAFIENINYETGSNHLHINGRFTAGDDNKAGTTFQIQAKDKRGEIVNKNINSERFSIEVKFEDPLPGGLLKIKASAVSPAGERFDLHLADGTQPLAHIPKIYTRHWALLGIILTAIALTYSRRIQQSGLHLANWTQQHVKGIAAGILIFSLSLVLIGITGSSFRIALEGPVAKAISTASGSDARIFKLQSSRGDEWGILTPNILAQVNHTPPFPIINTNLGIDGQNMGILGMTGAPVAQWAAIARPATWGYFFLPLRQAQSWQWQLPFWGCLLALWWLLNLFKPQSAGRNLALATLFCIAPYAAAWSNWPLYFTLFPVLAFSSFIKLLESKRITHALLWGAGIGYSIAAWVLTLYPPWMVTIGTLCALLCIGLLLDRRSSPEIQFKLAASGLTLGLVIATVILGSWWLDTRDAIELTQKTVYPGQRTTLTGGTGSILWTFRGFTNAEAITFGGDTPWTNQPEISSYIWLPLAMLWLCAYGLAREKRNRCLLLGCTIFIVYYFVFTFIGVPEWMARLTLWGRAPTNRTDVSLGLAFIILLCLTRREWFIPLTQERSIWPRKAAAAIIAIGSSCLAYAVLAEMPVFIFPKNSIVYISVFLVFSIFCAWWLTHGKTSGPIALLLILSLVATFGFNPIAKAPKKVEMTPEVKMLASDENGNLHRILFVSGEGMGPHLFAAVGLPTINGVLAYPQLTLWKRLQLPEKDWPIVNRYQHLAFTTGKPANYESYSVSSPWMEWVVVTIDPEKFDFNLTGAQRITAFDEQAENLRKSPLLKEIGKHKGLVWFSVTPPR